MRIREIIGMLGEQRASGDDQKRQVMIGGGDSAPLAIVD
jgi:hypothetical protein